jgi:hypothetical protein
MNSKEFRKRLRKHPFAYIAFWQLMVFALLVCLIWTSEIWNLPALYFGVVSEKAGFFREWVLTVAVVICAIIMVGNTYIQQKRVIHGLLVVCAYCGKIQIGHDVWQEMQRYLTKHAPVAFSHGMCPDCYTKVTGEPLDKNET